MRLGLFFIFIDMKNILPIIALALVACNPQPQEAATTTEPAPEPLPSWNEGSTKEAIIQYVETVTNENNQNYIPPSDRIATFDNDGCLWTEQPLYSQLLYTLDRINYLAPTHPEWVNEEPFASVLSGDLNNALAGGEEALLELVMATHAESTTTEFSSSVTAWLDTAVHPLSKRPYTEMVYQPMLELLSYLRANGFKTFIVSGGGIDFMRPWTESIYGIPSEQVVGSSIASVSYTHLRAHET